MNTLIRISKTTYATLLIGSIIFLNACSKSFLEESPLSQGAPENFYKTELHAKQALTGVYDGLQPIVEGSNGPIQLSLATDLMRGNQWGGTSGLKAYVISPDDADIRNYWGRHYYAIKNANTAIENIPGIEMNESVKADYIGQARFIRGIMYLNLVRTFGAVPYVTKEFTSLTTLRVPRNTVEEIYEGIIEDFQYAAEHVKGKDGLGSYKGYATKESAQAFLALTHLTRGSMMVRDGKGDGKADFTEAAKWSKKVIDSRMYKLCDYFPDAFIRDNKNNDEIIFDVQFKTGGLGEGNYMGMGFGLMGDHLLGGSWGTLHSTRYFHLLYDRTDSVRQQWTTTQAVVRAREVNGVTVGYIDNSALASSNERWKIGKFRRFPIRGPFNFSDHDMNWPFMRYSEVLLIYAEALNEVNQGTPGMEVFNALNELRKRARTVNTGSIHDDIYPRSLIVREANVPDLNPSDYPNYASMKQYIMDERARELGGEGVRWFDLIRWGKLIERVKLLENESIFPEGERSDAVDGWYQDISVNIRPHHMLLPIPSGELQANPSLLPQNNGY